MDNNTAPKDGQAILLLSERYENIDWNGAQCVHEPRVHIGHWWPEGDSWVDEHGQLGGNCYELAVTGVWTSGSGWFQPNEVTQWMPLPLPPEATGERESKEPVPLG